MSISSHSKKTLTRRRWLTLILIALILSACSYAWYDYRFPKWEDEVSLPDGRKIIVKQRRDFIEGHGTRKTWLTFSLPEMGGEQTWEQWLYPAMIGVIDGKVYVIGRPRGSKQFRMYSHPRYVYVAYEWRNERFERVPFLAVPEPIRQKENIRWCLPGGEDSRMVRQAPDQWCVEKMGDSKFPMPQVVNLQLREAEAKYWAKLEGHAPDSE